MKTGRQELPIPGDTVKAIVKDTTEERAWIAFASGKEVEVSLIDTQPHAWHFGESAMGRMIGFACMILAAGAAIGAMAFGLSF